MKSEDKMVTKLVVGSIVLAFGVFFVCAKMESVTYNRLTGASTTWWDAVWVELRVMEPTKQP